MYAIPAITCNILLILGTSLIVFASYSPVPTSISWMANNVIGYKKVVRFMFTGLIDSYR